MGLLRTCVIGERLFSPRDQGSGCADAGARCALRACCDVMIGGLPALAPGEGEQGIGAVLTTWCVSWQL